MNLSMCNKLLTIVLSISLFACGNKKEIQSSDGEKQGGLVTFHLNAPPSSVEPLMLSVIADSVSYVALETRNESLTDDGIQMGDRFYAFSHGEILCFDKKGKYLHRVGKPGRGPEEFFWLSALFSYFNADPIDNWVYIHSHDMRTQVYDENDRYVKTLTGGFWGESLSFVYNHLAYQINGNSAKRTNEDVSISIISDTRKGKELYNKKAKPIAVFGEKYNNTAQIVGSGMYASYASNDAFYRWIVFQDTMYMAHNGEIRPYCLIIPKNKFKAENQFDNIEGIEEARIKQPMIRRMYVMTDKILLLVTYMTDRDQGNGYYVLCDMKDGSVKYFDKHIVNDLDGGPNIINNINIYCLSAEDFINDEEIYNKYFTKGVEAKLKDQDGKFQRLLKTLVDDANPIMRVIHWK